MLLNRVILKYCAEEAGKEAFACARTPRLRLRRKYSPEGDIAAQQCHTSS